jgi:glucosamine kinase
MVDLLAALDGGGTKTRGAIADVAGHVVLTPAEPGCNPQDNPDWAAVLRRALAHLPGGVAQVALGMPGFGEVPSTDRTVLALTAEILPGRIAVLNDVAMAYRGAFPDGGGALVLAGTGSMAMALGPAGLVRTGGWGDAFGDEGSAFWIGRAALALAARMEDGRTHPTRFAAALRDALGTREADGPFALLAWVMSQPHPRSAIASVARHVDALAEAGDPDAVTLLDMATAELHLHLTTAGRLAALAPPFDWAVAGSVFRSATVLRALTRRMGTDPVPARLDALGGGLRLAAKAAGWPADALWISKIAASLAALQNQRTNP